MDDISLLTKLRALCQSVVAPHRFLEIPEKDTLLKYGSLLIVLRWLGTSVIYQVRDYHGAWKPLFPPPFGVDVDTYALFQKYFSLAFGFGIMAAVTIGLAGYLRLIKKGVPMLQIFNILGFTFFLPSGLALVFDVAVVYTVGFGIVVIPFHTLVLMWESAAAVEIISGVRDLKLSEKVLSTAVIMVIWILLCAALWR